jgi:hypothetical protein
MNGSTTETNKTRGPARPAYALRIVNRETGEPLRSGDEVLTFLTRNPFEAARDAMRTRDARVWRVRAEPISARSAVAPR